MEQKNEFEITVNGCTVKFGECTYNTLENRNTDNPEFTKCKEIIISAYMPDEGVNNQFIAISEECGTCIGSLVLNQMPTFTEFKHHILGSVPEEARRQGVNPFEITDIRDSKYARNDEVVTLSIIAAGKWAAFTIEMTRFADKFVVQSLRSINREMRRQLDELTRKVA